MQELRVVLEKHGFRFKKQFGQNFISDGNLLKSIVEASGITKDTTVVEIGCGAGTLTRALAEAAKRVYAFDIDRDLQPVLAETLAGLDNVEVIFGDAMKRAKLIKSGEYDFSLDEQQQDDGLDEIPEELAESEEDKEKDKIDEEKGKKLDKIFNVIIIAVAAIALGVIVYRIVQMLL